VTEVVPAGELEARTMAFARALSKRAPLAVRLAKAMMMRGLDMTLDQSLSDAALSVMVSNPSADVREGVKAFFEKREPRFEGR
jgi:enoyl-CoA hydratase/carnithine racemase